MKIYLFLPLAALTLPVLHPTARCAAPSTSDASCCTLAEVDQAPQPLQQPAPLYPAELKAAKISGQAVVSFIVDQTGCTQNVTCVQQTQPALGAAATAAVIQWRFSPARKGAESVPCRLTVPIVFSLAP